MSRLHMYLTTVAATVCGLLTACIPPTPHFEFVLGATATANEPAVGLGPDTESPLWDAVQHGTVQLTAFVGAGSTKPIFNQDMSVYYDKDAGEIEQADKDHLSSGYTENMKGVHAALDGAASNQNQLDLLGLLGTMARRSGPATLLVYSSGLQTSGLLDLRGWGSDLDVAGTVDSLDPKDLPVLTDKHVIFFGLGEVAGPQRPLTERMLKDVDDLWLGVCRKAGGTCEIGRRNAGGGAPHSTVAVPTIPVPTLGPLPKWVPGEPTIIPLPNGIIFQKNTADFQDGAEAYLHTLVPSFLPGDGSVPVRATAIGHTATWGPYDTAVTLSKQRARRVVDYLVANGVDANLFTVVDGVGYDHPLIPDLDASGHLLPGHAERNRTVELTVTRIRS
jgi:OOP family OmpA-OmpF porin